MAHDPEILGAIFARPDDDTLRMVYADWLEEHGQMERAEFIRLQVRIAELERAGPQVRHSPRYRQLWDHELKMIRTHKDEWFGSMRSKFSYWECRRGFIDEVRAPVRVFFEHADKLFARHPVRVVHVVVERVVDLSELANCRHLCRLASLRVECRGPSLMASLPSRVNQYVAGSTALAAIPFVEIYSHMTEDGQPFNARFEHGKRVEGF